MTDQDDPGAIEPVSAGHTSGGGQSVSAEERKRKVSDQIRMEVTQGGRVESQGDFDAVVATGSEINHTAHLIATIFTCGLWGIVWLVIVLTGGIKRKMISVDDYGRVLVQKIETK